MPMLLPMLAAKLETGELVAALFLLYMQVSVYRLWKACF
jgi:hypothetical protein